MRARGIPLRSRTHLPLQYPTSPFIIPTHPPLVILPMSVYLESKQYAGQDFNSESYERFMGRWTGVGTTRGEVVPTIRQDLTKSIASILPLIQNETHYAFDKELGRPQDWKPVPLHATVLRMVALLSGRVFVGYPLNRSEEWLDASINYTTALAGVLRDSMIWNPLLIPFVGGWLPSVRRSIQYLKMAQKWMKPLLAEVLSRETEKTGPVKVGARGTFISWLLKYLPENQRTAERIGMDQMIVGTPVILTCKRPGLTRSEDIVCGDPHDEFYRFHGTKTFIRWPEFRVADCCRSYSTWLRDPSTSNL